LQHWLERLAAAQSEHDHDEFSRASKFVAAYQTLINALESVRRER
jgi:hypothetical protein